MDASWTWTGLKPGLLDRPGGVFLEEERREDMRQQVGSVSFMLLTLTKCPNCLQAVDCVWFWLVVQTFDSCVISVCSKRAGGGCKS